MALRILSALLLFTFISTAFAAEQVSIYGTILQPDGKPAENATVAMATLREPVSIRNGGRAGSYGNQRTVQTNTEGEFKFPNIDFEAEAEGHYQPEPGREKVDFILVVLHEAGFARVMQQDWNTMGEKKSVTLQPWGRIEGTVRQGTLPGKGLMVQCIVYFTEDGIGYSNEPVVFSDYDVIADESGKFVFDRVPPAFVRVGRAITISADGMSTISHAAERSALKPGETRTVTLGGVGRPVTGKLIPAAEFDTQPDWGFAYVRCISALEKIGPPDPATLAKMREIMEKMVPKEIREGLNPARGQEWIKTEDGKKFQSAMEELVKDSKAIQERNNEKRYQQRVCAVAEDGTFRLDDIFEGDWQLTVELNVPPNDEKNFPDDPIGKLEYQFSVSAISNGVSDEPLELGSLEVEKVIPERPMPRVGATAPSFEIKKIKPLAENGQYEDKGEKLRLSDYKGKYVILNFWATWCGPCLAKVPELQKFYEKIKDNDKIVLIGLSLDGAGSEEKLGKFILRRKMPWIHGLAGDWNGDTVLDYGVRAIPTMFLVDPEGKVLMSDPELEKLVRKVEELL